MSEPKVQPAPPVGEQIHMPPSTIVPLLNALATVCAILGLMTSVWITFVALIFVAISLRIWIRAVRHEMNELPESH